jgi:hypothetical protein
MLWKEHLSRNVDDEAKKSCDKANKVWEEFRKHLDWLGPFQESKKDS